MKIINISILALILLLSASSNMQAFVSIPVENSTDYPIAVIVYPGSAGLLYSSEAKEFTVPYFYDNSIIKKIEIEIAEFLAKKKLGKGLGGLAGGIIKGYEGCYRDKGIAGAKWPVTECKKVKAMDVQLIDAQKTTSMRFWQGGLFRNYLQIYQLKPGKLKQLFTALYTSKSIVTTPGSRPKSIAFTDDDFKGGKDYTCMYLLGYKDVINCLLQSTK